MQTSEFVSLGHPDKVADYISEYILDRLIEQDPQTRYALEVQIKDEHVTLGGEITTKAENLDYAKWVVEAIEKIGYTKEYFNRWGQGNTINPEAITVSMHISQQSQDIALGVNKKGWGDQGIMFGMAVADSTTGFMPKDWWHAQRIGRALYYDSRDNKAPWGLDIKTQVTTNKIGAIEKLIVAAPLKDEKYFDALQKRIKELIPLGNKPEIIINGTGSYIKHASIGDCGTTGRKLAVDFYGGNCEIGGGSPWTKDGTKADLTLNIFARQLALKELVENKSNFVKTAISCCIGKESILYSVLNNKNEIIEEKEINVTPESLIKRFGLNKPIFSDLCEHGLFSKIL